MKKILLTLLVAFSMTSYGEVFRVYAPEYIDDALENFDISKPVQVQIIEYESRFDLAAAYEELGEIPNALLAFQVWNGEICEIHVMESRGWNDIQRQADLGHELLHCYGAHHDNTL